ncbi:MAG TPA: antibiotic biosynthesis monooxygenase [Ramlibacter sp.]|nr:antibiotic biosynthesis monooxygenase [Ramlibacter sp.]
MPEVAIIATLEVEPNSRNDLLPLLQRHRERCLRDEPGTLAFEVLVPQEEPDRLMLYERYKDREAFDAHWNGKSLAITKAAAGARLKKISGVFCTPA